MFNEDSCKICVWNVHTQVAIRRYVFNPPSAHVQTSLVDRDEIAKHKAVRHFCEFAKSHSLETSGESSPAHTKGASLGGKASVSPILCGQSLCGQTIELLRSRGRRKKRGHKSSRSMVGRPVNRNNSGVIMDVRKVGQGREEHENDENSVYQCYS